MVGSATNKSFLVLNAGMRPAYRKKVIQEALDCYDEEADRTAHQRFKRAIRGHVRIKGFQDPLRAPRPLLQREVEKCSYHSNAVLGAILAVWAESHVSLQTEARTFLRSQGLPVVDPADFKEGFSASWATTEMFETVAAFQAQHADFDKDDVVLMLCYLTGGRAPLPVDTEPRQEESSVMKWRQWLEELRALPADAPEWDSLTEFIDELQLLDNEKRQEREAARDRLRHALATLLEQATDELDYFGISDVRGWSADRCPLHESAALAEQVEQLGQDLLQHRALRHNMAANLAEERQRRNDLETLEAAIIQTHERLAQAFTSPAPDSSPPSPPREDITSMLSTPSSEEVPHTTVDIAGTSREFVAPEPPGIEPPESGPTPEEVVIAAGETAEETLSDGPEAAGTSEQEVELPATAESSGHEERESSEVKAELQRQVTSVDRHELRSSHEIATLLLNDDREALWQAFFWALIAEDDVAAAYWLAQSRRDSGRSMPVPDWLLAAVQGGRWIAPDAEAFVYDLLGIAQENQPTSENVQSVLGLAAALCPVLLTPASGMLDWLRVPTCCPTLYDLVQAVTSFAHLGTALRPEYLLGVNGKEQRETTLVEAARDTKQRLDEASGQRTKFQRASAVWQRLVGPEGPLRNLFLPVCEDRREAVEDVRQGLSQWQQTEYIVEQIGQIDHHGVKRRSPIVGGALEQIRRNVEKTCALAQRWCDLADNERTIEARGSWLFDQVAGLRDRVQRTLPEVEDALGELSHATQPAPLAASGRCLWRSVRQLCEILELPYTTDERESLAIQTREGLIADVESLSGALSHRLLWCPELSLGGDGAPSRDALPMVPQVLRDVCIEQRTLSRAFEAWCEKQDYRFAEKLMRAMRDEADLTDISRRYQEALIGSREALRDDLNRTNAAIEQAMVDGVIAEERTEYNAILVGIDPEEVLNFHFVYERLCGVRKCLSIARTQRLDELQATWRELEEQLAQRIPSKVHTFITDAFERQDTRVIEESIARLTEMLDVGSDLEESWFTPPSSRDVLMEFKQLAPGIERWLEQSSGLRPVMKDIEKGRTQADLRFGGVPTPRLQEALRALAAWRSLKQRRTQNLESSQPIITLMRYLGFDLGPHAPTSVRFQGKGEDWLHAHATMSVSDVLVKPIPQFGSQAQGHYDVICLLERPGADAIAARLRELRLDRRNVLMLYLGRLTGRQQREVSRICREQELALALLDEKLLVFLAQERDARLPIFLRCALPYTALNPYTPFQAGNVPPEMFFGRETMARDLQRAAGSCLVYGGRQLGKSALLRHVSRQFHYPEREQFAWVEDMKLIFDPVAGKGTANVWRVLWERFRRENLLPKSTRAGRDDTSRDRIRDALLLQSPQCRVLVMFDEADDFLATDSKDDFRVVTALRGLMQETERRFKVIFAGLHHVQRFQGIPNQPLAHFGTPICVGPLEPLAAQQLVRQPLETLGYRFADDATVLRVLSYTNYHPGLIQLFCQELLKRLHNRTGSPVPPYSIEQNDVEAVYRRPGVYESIRDRFDWTLALDTRYQAIAWTMILDQMERRDSYAQTYPPGDLLKLVHDWWPQGFGDMSNEKLRGLLNEMCGLGVLVRNTNGHYRLRSPNLVRLMGTNADIEDRLFELAGREAPSPFVVDSHHVRLDDEARRYSPLSYAQERDLNPPQFGVGLVFASEALGLSLFPQVFERFIPSDLPEDVGDCTEIPADIATGDRLSAWLRSHLQSHSQYEHLVVYQRLVVNDEQMLGDLVKAAQRFCIRHKSHKRWMRVLFLFHPSAAWPWLLLPEGVRIELEEQADAVVAPHRWEPLGIRQRLEQHDKLHSEEICQLILQVTGGWTMLLDELFDRCAAQDDPRPVAQALQEELTHPSTELAKRFRASLGLVGNEVACRVQEFLFREGPLPVDWESSELVELIGGDSPLSTEACLCAIEYLQRVGCLVRHNNEMSLEATVRMVLAS
ncbi:hypothetical protein NKDENANG_01847 [Candidatus Entotheonellaceae bacterium PAL068K]